MDLRERIASLMSQVRPELAELVAIRSVADTRQFPPEECARAARRVMYAFARAGFADARLAETADRSQAVLRTRPCPDPDAPTVLLYAHYDVQPPLNEAGWQTPPFELTESGGRWYGRGAADCTGNILMHLTALRALGEAIPVNLKLVLAGRKSRHRRPGGVGARARRPAARRCDPGLRRRERGRGPPGRHGEPAGRGRRRGPRAGTGVGAALGGCSEEQLPTLWRRWSRCWPRSGTPTATPPSAGLITPSLAACAGPARNVQGGRRRP